MGRSGYSNRRLRVPGSGLPVPHEFDVTDLTPGIWANRAASEIPINAATMMEDVRFERTGIRPDFGENQIGDEVTDGVIVGIGEHKWIEQDTNSTYHRVIRVVQEFGGYPRVDTWDGAAWNIGASNGSYTIGQKVDIVSTQNYLLFCDYQSGNFFVWDPQNPTIELVQQDWSFTTLSGEGVISEPISRVAYDGRYTARIKVSVNLTVRFIKPEDEPHTLTFRVLLRRGGSGNLYWSQTYDWGFDPINGDTFTFEQDYTVSIEDELLGGRDLYLQLDNLSFAGEYTDFSIAVRGFRFIADGAYGVEYEAYDNPAGTLYYISDHPNWASNNQPGQSPPKPSMLFPFGDRLIAIQDQNAPYGYDPHQAKYPSEVTVRSSADGNVMAWTENSDSTITYLLDSPNDPFDALMAMGFVANNIGALIRQRTIMRVSETGNVLFPLRFDHWIEGIGTESPFSVVQARDGICFLGHNLMVYYFDGTGAPQPVGVPIHNYLIRDVTDNLWFAHGVYDWVFEEYIIGVPENGATGITRLWIFDVGAYLDEQQLRWRTRSVDTNRISCLAAVSTL